jgi:membrane-associated phospholipid phosphatase
VTNFGDPAVTLPIVALIFFWLWFAVSRPLARRWLVAVAACGLAMTGLLVLFHLQRDLFASIRLRVPSGHVAGTVLAYGGLAVIVAQALPGRWRIVPFMAGAAAVAVVALTRLRLQAHSIPEILLGAAVGLSGLLWFSARYFRLGAPAPHWKSSAAAAVVLVVATYGARLQMWDVIKEFLIGIKSMLLAA